MPALAVLAANNATGARQLAPGSEQPGLGAAFCG